MTQNTQTKQPHGSSNFAGRMTVGHGNGTLQSATSSLSHDYDCVAISLTPYEIEFAAHVGIRRHCSALQRCLHDKHGVSPEGSLIRHIEGALAEMATARALGLYWDGSVDVFKRADICNSIQVRLTEKTDNSLIVRENDPKDHQYVLVTGGCGNYVIRGWLTGREACRLEWRKAYGKREPAYFVPQSALHPLDTLQGGEL